MNNFWRNFFWPLLFYAMLFMVMSRDMETPDALCAILAGMGAAALALCMTIFITLPDSGLPWRKAANLRLWPPKVRRDLVKTELAIAVLSALCLLGAFLA